MRQQLRGSPRRPPLRRAFRLPPNPRRPPASRSTIDRSGERSRAPSRRDSPEHRLAIPDIRCHSRAVSWARAPTSRIRRPTSEPQGQGKETVMTLRKLSSVAGAVALACASLFGTPSHGGDGDRRRALRRTARPSIRSSSPRTPRPIITHHIFETLYTLQLEMGGDAGARLGAAGDHRERHRRDHPAAHRRRLPQRQDDDRRGRRGIGQPLGPGLAARQAGRRAGDLRSTVKDPRAIEIRLKQPFAPLLPLLASNTATAVDHAQGAERERQADHRVHRHRTRTSSSSASQTSSPVSSGSTSTNRRPARPTVTPASARRSSTRSASSPCRTR